MSRTGLYLAIATLAAAAGFALNLVFEANRSLPSTAMPPAGAPSSDALGGRPRPLFSLPDLDGNPVSIERWDGKVILLNFWATWCPPCRREIPAFIQVRKQYAPRGFEVIGVAIDDHDAVREYVAEMGMDYPQLISETEAIEVSRRYGNRMGALPYSVLIDREGTIRFSRPGELSRRTLEEELEKLL